MKNLKNNTLGLTLLIVGFIIGTLGITYSIIVSFMNVQEVKNSFLVLGDIYMHYNETNQLSLENAMPSEGPDESKYFEFTVSGKNTYKQKDIYYEIILDHGDDHAIRTERIRDDLLKFRLVEIKDNTETVVLDNESYTTLKEQRIWVNTINKNTQSDIEVTYRLYMWIDYDTVIGNTTGADYDMNTWNNQVYGSIKVNVKGSVAFKTMSTNLKDNLVESIENSICKSYVIDDDEIIHLSGENNCINFNYVKYSNMIWRITSINPDGTLRMITEDSVASRSWGSKATVSDTDLTSAYSTSSIRTWLNNDFFITLNDYENMIVPDVVWDASTMGTNIITTVTDTVGLLSVYEYSISRDNASYNTGYLKKGYNWWLTNPSEDYGYVRVGSSSGGDGFASPTSYLSVRPVINLKSEIVITSGIGSNNSPYEIGLPN